jgi:AraC family transcriptional regulator of adaptative response/methylated-DNA-[protein]-cysteine methyltransferase
MIRPRTQSRDHFTPVTGTSVTDVTRWAAVIERNSHFDGSFVYSVATTGVYCRPSCPGRLAKRMNVRFHATCADAEAAGFRPCKRCKPA